MKYLNQKFFPEVELHDFFAAFHNRSRESDTLSSILKFLNDKGFLILGKVWRSMTLYDLCEEIIRVFYLNQDADPFIISFLETVNEFLTKNPSDLGAFLEWYAENGSEKSISIPDGVDAVKVLTIHKSKGMEFPVVIYPFADENATSKNVFRWVRPHDDEFKELPAMMISVGKSLMETSYDSSFTDENDNALLDMINLSYVALTRAEDALFVISRKMKSDATLSFNNLLWKFLIQLQPGLESSLAACFGELKIHKQAQGQVSDSSLSLSKMISGDWKTRIILKPGSERLWDNEQNRKTEWGNLVHLVLSAMIVEDDLPKVLCRFVSEGLLDAGMSLEIGGFIEKMLNVDMIRSFFRPGIQVLNESEILTAAGQIYRPDRIIIEENQNIIIDYKTGKPIDEHKSQVQTYAGLLTEINQNPSLGYLIYLDNPVSLIQV
jgi:ATP-dependent exoDNAse (exonuclease V) beta subunit